MEAEIYSKTNCGYCDRAKLRLAKFNPKIYMLDTDYTREDFFEKFPNAKTFPQIILNGERITLKLYLAFSQSSGYSISIAFSLFLNISPPSRAR